MRNTDLGLIRARSAGPECCDLYQKYGLFIDGVWRGKGGQGTLDVRDPATANLLGSVPAAGPEDVEEAIAAAQRGQKIWQGLGAWARADILHKVSDAMADRTEEAARQITLEAGKPLAQSRREWGLSIDQFRWHAEEARRVYGRIVESRVPGGRIEVFHQPVGVVAAFTAWNFPAVLIARKVAPALAAGCSIVVRPSSEVPGVAMLIFECLRLGGLPKGVANLVIGSTSATYPVLMAAPAIRKVSLTGSTAVGQQMIRDAASTLKRVSMELGGNAPMIVFEDADVERTLDLAVPVKYANAGQVCVTPDRFYIHESIHGRFLAGFVARASALRIGPGLDEATQVGPLINERRLHAIEDIVKDAIQTGAKIETGGCRPTKPKTGYFFEPTVLSDVADSAKALAQENFGPIAAITSFASDDEAYARANSSPSGLAAYVFTTSAGRLREAVARIEAGMVGVNTFALAAAEGPFGGIKDSGMGREGGTEGILDYMNVKLSNTVI